MAAMRTSPLAQALRLRGHGHRGSLVAASSSSSRSTDALTTDRATRSGRLEILRGQDTSAGAFASVRVDLGRHLVDPLRRCIASNALRNPASTLVISGQRFSKAPTSTKNATSMMLSYRQKRTRFLAASKLQLGFRKLNAIAC